MEDSFSFPPEPPGLGASEGETESVAAQEAGRARSEPGSNEDSSSSSSSSSSSEDSDAQDQELREGSGDPSSFEQSIVEGRLIFNIPKRRHCTSCRPEPQVKFSFAVELNLQIT